MDKIKSHPAFVSPYILCFTLKCHIIEKYSGLQTQCQAAFTMINLFVLLHYNSK